MHVLLTILLFISFAASAEQDKGSDQGFINLLQVEEEIVEEIIDFQSVQSEYQKPDYKALVDLYIKMGVLDFNDTTTQELYLLLNQCQMAVNHYADDLKWPQFLNKTQEFLAFKKEDFPNRFKFIRKIQIGRYNLQKEVFPVLNASSYKNVRRILMTNNSVKDDAVCNDLTVPELNAYAPYNAALDLVRTFSLPYVPASEELARFFLDYTQDTKNTKDDEELLERTAYIVFYVTVHDFVKKSENNKVVGNYYTLFDASLDQIEIYADQDLSLPLYAGSPYYSDDPKFKDSLSK